MTRFVMVGGTSSGAGKSWLATTLYGFDLLADLVDKHLASALLQRPLAPGR
jgi:hypothetical protein